MSADQVVHKGDTVIDAAYELLQCIVLRGLANNELDANSKDCQIPIIAVRGVLAIPRAEHIGIDVGRMLGVMICLCV